MAEDDDRRSDEALPVALRTRLRQIEKGYIARADQNRDRINKFAHRVFILLGLLAAIQLGLGGLSLHLTSKVDDSQTKLKTALAELKKAQAANRATVVAIQESRIENTWIGCFSGDKKSVDARRAVEGIIASAPASPASPEQQQGTIEFRTITVTLLDSFLPYNDCPSQLKHRFGLSYPHTVPHARQQWLALDREHAAQVKKS